MHQVLSYETAVRVNDSREYRDYVTKRTCVGLLLIATVAALIAGYVLGSLVGERKFQTRQVASRTGDVADRRVEAQNSIQVPSDDYSTLQEIHAYAKGKEKLLASAHGLSKMLQQQDRNYVTSSLNTEIFNKYISCTQDIPPNTSIDAAAFIEQLIDNTAARQRDCLRIIQLVLDNNLTTG